MSVSAHLPFDTLNTALKAAGEATRLRVLMLLAEAELTVSDLTQILRQSQPRISRHLKLMVEAGLIERFREGSWAFFRLAERGASAELAQALVARLDPEDPIAVRDRERLVRGAARARGRGAGIFPRPCRAVGPHPQAACRRRGGRGRDQRRIGRTAVPFAARSRHRHRPHAGAVRRRHRPRARHRSLARHAAAGARAHRTRRPAQLQRPAGRHLRSRGAGGLVRRRADPSGAALPRRRRPRDPRGRARAGAVRPAAGRRLRAARSRIPARGARAPAPRLRVRRRRAMDERGRPRHDHASQPAAGAGLRRQGRGLALARPRSARADRRRLCGRWRDGCRVSASRSSSFRPRPRRWSGTCGRRSSGSRR